MTDEDDSASTDQFKQFVLAIEVPSRFRRTIRWLRRHIPWYRRGKWIDVGATEGGIDIVYGRPDDRPE